jgi:hypothetical protein
VPAAYDGLLIDVGGVLTSDLFAGFDGFCAREGLSGVSFEQLYFDSPDAQALFHRLELGEVDPADAELGWRACSACRTSGPTGSSPASTRT